MYVLVNENVNTGNIRETFFLNQMKGLYNINISKQSDFLVEEKYTFEIGGKHKSKKQIAGLSNAYIVKDQIEVGFGNIIPIWLFGFLY
jgi:hypothetical protein